MEFTDTVYIKHRSTPKPWLDLLVAGITLAGQYGLGDDVIGQCLFAYGHCLALHGRVSESLGFLKRAVRSAQDPEHRKMASVVMKDVETRYTTFTAGEQWKEEGNVFFDKEDFAAAICLFTVAIEKSPLDAKPSVGGR